MTFRSTITRLLALAVATAAVTTSGFAQETPAPKPATLPIGDWCYNGDETNIFQIQKDRTAVNFKTKGTWIATGDLLTITWENGVLLTIDTTQTGTWIDANSIAPNETKPYKIRFKKLPPSLPAERTLVDTQGRAIKVTVLRKSPDGITVRKQDGKEFNIPLDKLSDADRGFLATADVKKPKEFSQSRVFYGYHLIFRIKEDTFAVEINAKADSQVDRKFDNCAYAVSYTIRRHNKNGNFDKIKEGVAKETRPPKGNEFLTCEYFKFPWSAGSAATGHLYLDSLPEGTEFYGELLASLEDFDSQIDPKKWGKLTK